MKPLLSILIPTVVGREESAVRLIFKLLGQAKKEISALDRCGMLGLNDASGFCLGFFIPHNNDGGIECLCHRDDKSISVGEKRELLYKKATGLYAWQIDDDDDVSDDAIKLILEAITQTPDCITFQEHININGVIEKSNHSLEYGDWEGEGGKELWDGFHYHRTPFMKSVIKTEIARSVPIPHIRFGEDHQWAQALKPHLKSEIHIPQDIYFYQHISTPFNERYGFDK